jgi:hypothetical protein
MKQKIILIFLVVSTISGNAQIKKGLALFTDRDVYVSGETLLAKIYDGTDNPSRIAYVDLVNQSGKRISGISVEMIKNEANGFLQLPDSLGTGTYLLRAYMKNTAEKLKTIREIWISNRFDGLGKTTQIKRLAEPQTIQEETTRQINIEGVEQVYATNSNIAANIAINGSFLTELSGNLLVSVAQTESTFSSSSYLWSSDVGKDGLNEKKGIILSGTIIDKATSNPTSGATVYLTIPDSIPGFQYYQTKDDGRFYFHLENYYGSVNAFVQCFAGKPTQRLKIKMDELFAVSGNLPVFSQKPISEEFKSNIAREIDAVTFQKVFGQEMLKLKAAPPKVTEAYPYYGIATNVVDPHLFIDLPNFTEISRELLPGVKFRNYNNEPTMQVIYAAAREYFTDMPLVLIDGIPIRNLNVIKDMGTKDIERIEISQNERYYGNLRFPGIVAIYTTKADYSMIPESDQFIQIKLETIQIQAELAEPNRTESDIPDLRQVFYWNPSAEPKENLSVKFNTSSILGKFKMVVRGRLKDGTMILAEKQFEVK